MRSSNGRFKPRGHLISGAPSIGSRNLFMVNSIFCDSRWRQLSSWVWYRSFGKRLEIFRGQLFGARALPGELLADEWVYGGMGRAQQSATRNGRESAFPHSETEFNGIGGLLTYIGDGPRLSK
jgi:hypothetical protein